MKEIYEKLNGLSISQKVAISEEGSMYGSIGTKEISDLLEVDNFVIERSSIRLPEGSLKAHGSFEIDIELHTEVIAKINLEIVPEES